ncbi:Tat pathway signal sequence domain protein [Streptomyces sp. NBC_01476]|uniref:sortase-dependent protein n=1 Tax=Streptomyces sp. NBC_01476 TaxID=2903881 RepID=UPI002E3596BD|nr:sortase-dependent protein [Streptomyces sp. NBC_01476]
MRRTILSVTALACTAVLAGAVPAFADGTTPTPVPSAAPTRLATPTPAPTRAPAQAPAPTAVPGGVAVVPKGAPDTGVAPTATRSGADGGLIGGGAAALVAAGGAAVLLVRRRRSAGA